ncbi:MAG: extracellular solute-binding protein [bacterium]
MRFVRWLISLLCIILALGILAVPLSAQKVLKMWNTAEALANPITQTYIEDFEKNHPGWKIEFFTYPWQEFRTKLLAAIAAGTGPDQMQLDTPWLVEFTDANLLDVAPASVTRDVRSKTDATNFIYFGA